MLDTSQVAITLGYQHQPGAGAPIDAGKSVADNGKVGDYRYSYNAPCSISALRFVRSKCTYLYVVSIRLCPKTSFN